MYRSNKKGFTIVELVVVIAVVAILAAVLIPTFASLVKKANASKDTQLVRDLNTAIAVYVNEALEGDETTIADALAAAAEFGYDIGKINAKADGNEILWDSVNHVFCYLNENEVQYVPEFAGKTEVTNNADFWVIANAPSATYSTYLVDYEDTYVEAKHSIDVTACGAIDVIYKGNATVSITLAGGNLTVEGGTVKQYGIVNNLVVADSANCTQNGVVASTSDDYTNAGAENAEYVYVATADELKAALAAKKAKIALSADIAVEADPSVGYDFTVVADTEINLNGYNITSVHNSASGSASANNGVFTVQKTGSLTLTGKGDITFKTNANMGWSKCTAVINTRGDVTIDGAVNVANLGGSDMSFAIDFASWSDTEALTLTVNAGTIYSAQYVAVRLNRQGNSAADMTTTFNIVMNGGVINGATSPAVMCHDGSANSDGIYNITVNAGAISGTSASRPAIRGFNGDENMNVVVVDGKVFLNGADVTSTYN